MHDVELLIDIFEQVAGAIDRIVATFSAIRAVNGFKDTQDGAEKLDSICMQLIAIGESIKNVDKITDRSFLSKYDAIDWKGVRGIRDIISHHYFDIDAEAIFGACEAHIPALRETVAKILSDLDTER